MPAGILGGAHEAAERFGEVVAGHHRLLGYAGFGSAVYPTTGTVLLEYDVVRP